MTAPYWEGDGVTLYLGDCREVLPTVVSADAVVTDPPYELGFMGRRWDATGVAYDVAVWRECLRVLKPGGYLLAFGGTRTYHRLACAVEDAGFEIRDSLHWVYGSGFPKSLDVGKAIDKAAGAQREVTGPRRTPDGKSYADRRPANKDTAGWDRPWKNDERWDAHNLATAPATEDAARWDGWGTALKPSHEPIVLARKPLTGPVTGNVLAHGTGALNIDGCRVEGVPPSVPQWRSAGSNNNWAAEGRNGAMSAPSAGGRWPPNVLLTHAADCNGDCAAGCPAAELDQQSGITTSTGGNASRPSGNGYRYRPVPKANQGGLGDTGGASRFFPVFRYQAKAPAAERPRLPDGTAHPTVKPLTLMRWLVRLVTPPGGTVLDPFCGTGATLQAALLEGFQATGIDNDPASAGMTVQRLSQGVLTAAEESHV